MSLQITTAITRTGLAISVTMQADLRAPIDAVFDQITAADAFPRLMTGYGPLPAVIAISAGEGIWAEPGAARLVHLRGGAQAREQVIAASRPDHFSYRTSDYTFALRFISTDAISRWEFDERQDVTHMRWTYTFNAKKAPAAAWLLGLFMRWLWPGYMKTCLRNLARLCAPAPPRI